MSDAIRTTLEQAVQQATFDPTAPAVDEDGRDARARFHQPSLERVLTFYREPGKRERVLATTDEMISEAMGRAVSQGTSVESEGFTTAFLLVALRARLEQSAPRTYTERPDGSVDLLWQAPPTD